MSGEAEEVGVVGHAHLVQDDHASLVELEPVAVEPPSEAGQRTSLSDTRLVTQRARRLARGCRPHNPVAGALEGIGDDP